MNNGKVKLRMENGRKQIMGPKSWIMVNVVWKMEGGWWKYEKWKVEKIVYCITNIANKIIKNWILLIDNW